MQKMTRQNLYIDGDLGFYQSDSEGELTFWESIHRWKNMGIRDIVVFGNKTSPDFQKLIQLMHKGRFPVYFVPDQKFSEELSSGQGRLSDKISRIIQDRIYSRNMILLYDRETLPEISGYAADLLERIENPETTPAAAEQSEPVSEIPEAVSLLPEEESVLKAEPVPAAEAEAEPEIESEIQVKTEQLNDLEIELEPPEALSPAPMPLPAVTPEPEIKEKPLPKPAEKPAPAVIKPEIEIDKNFKMEAPPVIKTPGFSIKFKLISVMTGLVVAALGSMILLATYFFRDDSQKRIENNTLRITEIIAQKVQIEFSTLVFRSRFLAEFIAENKNDKAALDKESDQFFQENSEILFVANAAQGASGLSVKEFAVNHYFLEDNALTKEDFQGLFELHAKAFEPAFGGAMIIHNASPGFRLPVLAFATPSRHTMGQEVTVVFINPAPVLKSFQSEGETTTYMVNSQGDIIAHPDSNLVFAASNLSKVPIVRSMQESKLDNGKNRFQDENGAYFMGTFKKLSMAGLGVVSVVQEDKAFEEVYNIQRRNLIIMLIVINITVLIVFFFSRSLTIPIVRLVGATQKIEEGDYEVAIKPASRDEVGILTSSFIHMAKGLKEREQMKDAFGKFVNKEIAEKVLRGEIKLGGERKEAAVFFSDLRGFTAMSEGLSPEEVVDVLNEYFTDMVKCVNDTHGVVDKFIGDAIMAHWGAVVSHGNDTENAVNAALMMRKALFKYNERQKNAPPEKRKPQLKFGCGINSGPVISGQIGSDERLEFTVIGDTVNLASRVETLNKPFATDVLISQDAYEFVKDIFKVEKMPSIMVKGKSEPQTIYAVLGRFDDPECPESMEEVRRINGIDPPKKAAVSKDGVLENDKEEKFEILE